jgi:hypothetical protein
MAVKGKTNNPNGRPAGIPNKATTEFKEALTKLMDTAAPDLVKWLGEIDDPFKRFEVLSKFAEFIHPKLGRTELANPEGEKFKVEQSVSEADKKLLERYNIK